jgi:hypothetical protein
MYNVDTKRGIIYVEDWILLADNDLYAVEIILNSVCLFCKNTPEMYEKCNSDA